jgi:AraC-like DNA-binding protein
MHSTPEDRQKFAPKLGGFTRPEERNEYIRHLYETERKSMREIAKEFGMSRQRVHQICIRAGASPKKYRMSPDEAVSILSSNASIRHLTALARAMGNRSTAGVRGMLARSGRLESVLFIMNGRREQARQAVRDKLVSKYLEAKASRNGAPLSVEEMREAGINAFRLNRLFGSNYMRKFREMCGEPPRKPRERKREEEPIAVEQPAPQEAGV